MQHATRNTRHASRNIDEKERSWIRKHGRAAEDTCLEVKTRSAGRRGASRGIKGMKEVNEVRERVGEGGCVSSIRKEST